MTVGTTRIKFALFSGVLIIAAIYAFAGGLTVTSGDTYLPGEQVFWLGLFAWALLNVISFFMRRGQKDLLDSTPFAEPHAPLDPQPVPDHFAKFGTDNASLQNKAVKERPYSASETPARQDGAPGTIVAGVGSKSDISRSEANDIANWHTDKKPVEPDARSYADAVYSGSAPEKKSN
jgi:hypothetical protein